MIPSAVDGGSFEGKQYGLPSEWNPGNINVVMYNKDMLQAKGVSEPDGTWTHDQFTEFATKLTDSAKGVYGTDLWPGTYYDFGDLVRDLGGDVMSDDRKKFLFGTDDKCKQVAQWLTELRMKLKVATASGGDAQEQIFPSGKIASTATGAVTSRASRSRSAPSSSGVPSSGRPDRTGGGVTIASRCTGISTPRARCPTRRTT